jgi:GTPase SAR1 family protein
METDSATIERAAEMIPIIPFTFERDPNPNMSACSFAIVGSSKSGKTCFLRYLLKKYFKDDIKVLMTQSLHNDIYTGMKKEMAVCPGYSPDVIKEMYKINKATKNHYQFMCIIDDLVGAKNDTQMMRLLALYRNSRIGACVVGQDAYMLNPTGRSNVNHSILFYQNTDGRVEDTVKQFLRSYFPRFLSMEQKIELYKRLTADHCFLWVNNLENTIVRCKLTPEQIAESEG